VTLALLFITTCVFCLFLFSLVWFFLWLPEDVLTLLFLLHHEHGDFSILMKEIQKNKEDYPLKIMLNRTRGFLNKEKFPFAISAFRVFWIIFVYSVVSGEFLEAHLVICFSSIVCVFSSYCVYSFFLKFFSPFLFSMFSPLLWC